MCNIDGLQNVYIGDELACNERIMIMFERYADEFDFSGQTTRQILNTIALFKKADSQWDGLDIMLSRAANDEAAKRLSTLAGVVQAVTEFGGTPTHKWSFDDTNADFQFPDMLSAATFATATRRFVQSIIVKGDYNPFRPFVLTVTLV